MPLGGGVLVCPSARVLFGADLGQLMLDARADRRAGVQGFEAACKLVPYRSSSPEVSWTIAER